MVASARTNFAAGYSLIELLIATTIAGLTIALATFSFGLFSQGWQRFSMGTSKASARLQRIDLVEQAVEAAVPWIVRDANGRPGYYFLGREEGFTLVTSRAMFAASGLAVIRLFRETEGDGTVRIVYEEAPLDKTTLRTSDQVLPFQRRVVVLRGLRGATFRYFGWADLNVFSRSLEGSSEKPLWFSAYDGLARGLHPWRVGIALDDNEIVYPIVRRDTFAEE